MSPHMYKKLSHIAIALLVSLSAQLGAAASDDSSNMDHSMVCRDSASAITEFPSRIYGHFCQGVVRAWSKDPSKLEALKKNTLRATKDNTQKLSTPDKEAYDYVYCLQKLQTSGLLFKSFKNWSVADVIQVNEWMTRLQTEEPGKFRVGDTAWPIRDLTVGEKMRLSNIQQQTLQGIRLSAEDIQFFHETNHMFPSAKLVSSEVARMLDDARGALCRLESSAKAQKVHDEINIASYVHHQIVAIHPWHEANKRTGRILSYVILMQHGIVPPVFPDAKEYTTLFLKNLKDKDCSPLSAYTRHLILKQQSK